MSLNFLLCEPHILVPTPQLGLHHATLGQETLWIPSLVEPGCEQLLLADLEDPFFTGEGLSTDAHLGTARSTSLTLVSLLSLLFVQPY